MKSFHSFKKVLIAVLVILFAVVSAHAAPPQTMHFQGYLKDAAGDPVVGSVDMVFALYDVASGGTALWSETHTGVPVDDGVYSVVLGSATPIDLAFDEPYYIGIAVGTDAEMTPRQELASSAYAFKTRRNTVVHMLSTETLITMVSYQDIADSSFEFVSNGAHSLIDVSLPVSMVTNEDSSGFGTIALNVDGENVYEHLFYLSAFDYTQVGSVSMQVVRTVTFKCYVFLEDGSHAIKLRAKVGGPDSSNPLDSMLIVYPASSGARGFVVVDEM